MDKKTLNSLIDEYIRTHYDPDDDDFDDENDLQHRGNGLSFLLNALVGINRIFSRKKSTPDIRDLSYSANSKLDFAINKKLESKGETFSEMLNRLISESGKKNSDIYKRANIKRQFFSKIMRNEEYQPNKQIVLAFALALRLEFEKTRELLASAGYILSRAKEFDLIIAACLENKFYDVDRINEILNERGLPLLGSRPEKDNKDDDET